MRQIHKTLLEQLQINDVEIHQRQRLLGLGAEDFSRLASFRDRMERCIDRLVDRFYEKQAAIDEIALLIGDRDTLQRLHSAQRQYVLDLFCGFCDQAYVNNRLRIGIVHKRIGVEPKLYLSAVKTLKGLLWEVLAEEIADPEQLQPLLESLDKLIYFDTTLVFDTYIDSLLQEVQSAKHKAEEYAESLEEKVAERTRELEALAKTDPLTGLFNQRAMRELLRRELLSAKRRGSVLTMAYFDVDKFKKINDLEGHFRGDEVLRHIGLCCKAVVRETDIACRYGGDEFCIVFPDCDERGAWQSCINLFKRFATQFPDKTMSVGLASVGPDRYEDEDGLLRRADVKMYEAKKRSGFSAEGEAGALFAEGL